MQGNSIRYRLRQPEVEAFKKYGSVTETVQLGITSDSFLRFALTKSTDNAIDIQQTGTTITISVPEKLAGQWTDSDLVGFDAIIEIGNEDAVKVLVEKDFKCLDGSTEDNIGAYPNPAKQC